MRYFRNSFIRYFAMGLAFSLLSFLMGIFNVSASGRAPGIAAAYNTNGTAFFIGNYNSYTAVAGTNLYKYDTNLQNQYLFSFDAQVDNVSANYATFMFGLYNTTNSNSTEVYSPFLVFTNGDKFYCNISSVSTTFNPLPANVGVSTGYHLYNAVCDMTTISTGVNIYSYGFFNGGDVGLTPVYLSQLYFYSGSEGISISNITSNATANADRIISNASAEESRTRDTLTNEDTTGSESSLSGVINDPTFADSSGVNAIINLPLEFINSLNSTCSPLVLNFPHFNNISIPCMSTIYHKFAPFDTILSLVINGFVIYRVLIELFYIVKSSRDPDSDRVEVLDL